jgi:psiF repeat
VSAIAVSLWLMPMGMVMATLPAAAQPAYTTAPPSTPPPSATSTDGSGSEAAARHAKRTACLKEAKAKKLVGAEKNSFIKDCVATH